MPISLPSSYEYDDIIQGPENPNPSPPRTPTTWYIEMEERHYEDMRQREIEMGIEQLQVNQSQQRSTQYQHPPHQYPANGEPVEHQRSTEDEEVQSSNVRCLCAMEAHLVVVRHGNDVGRRYFRCPLYTRGCDFGEWIDDRFCARAVAYALELEEENRMLRNQLNAYMRANYRLRNGST